MTWAETSPARGMTVAPRSRPQRSGRIRGTFNDLTSFICDCAACGVRAVSFGGGEPLESADLFPLLRALDGKLFRSVTTNGLALLREPRLEALIDSRPDKVHVSILAACGRSERFCSETF